MIDANPLYTLYKTLDRESDQTEQDWLRAEEDQQEWLRAQQETLTTAR
jgi:hypothetical protein